MKRTKDTEGRNTLYSLHYFDFHVWGKDYKTLDIMQKIAYKCCYGVEGRMRLCIQG